MRHARGKATNYGARHGAGIRIFCTEERSQGRNRERAMALLRSKLFDLELEKQRAETAAKRKSQVGSGIRPSFGNAW